MYNRKGVGMKEGHHYWCWDKEITHEACRKIINLGEEKWNRAQTFGSENENIEHDLSISRKSDVVWITDQWVYDLVWPFMLGANENAGWNYEIDAAESCQVTRYTKGGFYSWHRDGIGSHREVHNEPNNKFLHNNTRKLSMSIILNDDFEGGNFEFSREQLELSKGSVIVFPSFIDHRVSPVTKGKRYSLVAWFVGPPFK